MFPSYTKPLNIFSLVKLLLARLKYWEHARQCLVKTPPIDLNTVITKISFYTGKCQ